MQKFLLLLSSLFITFLSYGQYPVDEVSGFADLPIVLDGETVDEPTVGITQYIREDGEIYSFDTLGVETCVTCADVTADGVVSIAEGLISIASDAANAAIGNPAATTTFVSMPLQAGFDPNTYITSLADYNNIYVNDVFVGGYNLGDTYEYSGTQGDKVTSSKGHSGAYSISGTERPVEIASAANAGRQFFWFAFRQSAHRHVIQSLALESYVKVYGPNPTVNADGSSPDAPIQEVTLDPFGFLDFTTPTDGEYYILATQPVVVTTTNNNLGSDQRVLAPPSNELFGHTAGAASGDVRISALFANTNVKVYQQDGNYFEGVSSPGSPLSLNGFDSGIAMGIDSHYAPEGWFIIKADGPIAGFAGADAQGTNATTFQPIASASQVIGLSLMVLDGNNAGDSVSFCSSSTGTVKIYQNDGTFIASRELVRSGTLPNPATTREHQNYPAAARFASNEADFVTLNRGAYLISDVPINVVTNFHEGNSATRADDDETGCFGITPDHLRMESREGIDGLLYRRTISGGVATWVQN